MLRSNSIAMLSSKVGEKFKMEYRIIKSDDSLCHFGIKGMKWGERRWQYKDGSLTPEGRVHYGYGKNNKSSGQTKSVSKQSRKTNSNNGKQSLIKTAEQEYSGEKLKKAADDYRKEMITKTVGKDNHAFYINANDETIQQEFLRRENMKKAFKIGIAVVGVGAAVGLAYHSSAVKQAKLLNNALDQKLAKQILTKAQEDVDYVIPKGHTIHRMVGTENFDVSKQVGKRTYVSVNEEDRAGYALFLRDWTGTGKRYDVSLEAKKDIIAPSDKKAREIFQEVWDNNPEYENNLRKTLTKAYAEVLKKPEDDPSVGLQVFFAMQDPFKAGMYSFVRTGDDVDLLQKAYMDKGYTAIIDYFDKDSVGKLPIILFDAANETVKTGEQFVDGVLKREYRKTLSRVEDHPLYKHL